jgi:succinoglycan biosynthesis transport protein ExoP
MDAPPASEPSVLRTYLAVVRRRLGLIVLVAMVVTGTVVGLSLLQDPVYRATAQVLLQRRVAEQILRDEAPSAQPGDIATELELMRSGSIQDAVTAELGHTPDVSLARVGETSVVDISAEAGTADDAARDADTYATVYTDTRRRQTIEDLENASVELQGRISSIDAELAALPPPIDGEVSTERNSLQSRRDTYAEQLDALQVETNLTVTGGAQIVSEAEPPSSPISPLPWRDGGMALGIGLVVGVALAFLFEHLNDRVRSRTELDAATDGLTTLGLVPSVAGWHKHTEHEIISVGTDTTNAAEAFRSLRTAVQFVGIERGAQVVQITSAIAREGKTITAANLGITFARAGKRVVLVDCDLRRPRLHELFEVEREPGLVSVLLGEAPLDEAIVDVPGEERLALLPAGPTLPNPSDLLVSQEYAELVALVKAACDHAVIDTPPVLPVTDGLIVSSVVDQTLLVAAANWSTSRDVRRAVELLRQVDAPLSGAVLNMVPVRGRYGYHYFAGYDYFDGDHEQHARHVERDAARQAIPQRR